MPLLSRFAFGPFGRILPVVLGLPIVVAACSSDQVAVACPQAVRIEDAARLTRFSDAGRDLTDVLFEAEIKQLQLVCEHDEDVVEASLKIVFQALRGPANSQGRAPVRYFVAIADRGQAILAREEFDLEIPFQGNRTRVAISEELAPRIPLGSGESPTDYRVYVGFALSQEEMRYNRRR